MRTADFLPYLPLLDAVGCCSVPTNQPTLVGWDRAEIVGNIILPFSRAILYFDGPRGGYRCGGVSRLRPKKVEGQYLVTINLLTRQRTLYKSPTSVQSLIQSHTTGGQKEAI